ncbi:MAG: homogentisate 1,2-dioxygenase, partial [Flammeovirgaceae bacterium]|nr:homogentisate 1,2-dioxygenase [Flammeovirgaceae bacterium]MDW8288641.1 homogentisate 1,2-dioxygenase [Flammeovirgaceae bacterium]
MPYYVRLGEIPPKRHTQFRKPDGSLYREELVSSKGFSGIYSNLYHLYQPTNVREVLKPRPYHFEYAENYGLRQTHLKTSSITTTGKDYLEARVPLLANQDVVMSICCPEYRTMDYFYKNADGDELIFVHDGEGELVSQFGRLPFKKGDYVVIPRTTIYRLSFTSSPVRLLIIESRMPIE